MLTNFVNAFMHILIKNSQLGIALIVAIVILFVLWIRSFIIIVPQGFEDIVERFGRYHKTLRPGINFILPILDSIETRVCIKETLIQIRSQEVISRDNALIMVDGIAFYQIVNSRNVTYTIKDFRIALENVIMTNIRTVMGSLDLDDILSNRELINSKLLNVLDDITGPWGVKVVRVELKDITPREDLLDALAKQIKAERERRAVILQSEGIKASDILRAEGHSTATVLEAEANKRKMILEAEAMQMKILLKAEAMKTYKLKLAEANERQSEADAVAVDKISKAILQGGDQALNYIVANKYIQSIEKLSHSPNSKLILMPVESSKAIGALGGITELLNNFKEQDNNLKNENRISEQQDKDA